MPKLTECELFNLYLVSDSPNVHGFYELEACATKTIRDFFVVGLSKHLFGKRLDESFNNAPTFSIDLDGKYEGNKYACKRWLAFDTGYKNVIVSDIRKMIDTTIDPDTLDFYIVVNQDKTEFRWLIAQSLGNYLLE